jgi:hypothetical protein
MAVESEQEGVGCCIIVDAAGVGLPGGGMRFIVRGSVNLMNVKRSDHGWV